MYRFVSLLGATLLLAGQAHAAGTRCGWFVNPTPANAWLNDADGQWIVSTQGGHQAEGDWPEFADDEWVKTNHYYGYGCACLKAEVDTRQMQVKRIVSAKARPLSVCKADRKLSKPEF